MTAAILWALPVLACLLSGVAVVMSLTFARRLRAELAQVASQPVSNPVLERALTELADQIGQMRLRLEEVEQRKGPLADWPAAEPASVNLNRRGQVLRLYRRGDSVAHIASTLGLSTGEVALIVKVQEMDSGGGEARKTGE